MKAIGLAELLNVSEGLVSDMLNYRKGLSKDTVRILSQKFKLKQEAFNRPYELRGTGASKATASIAKKKIATD
jgi:HTH-type transcriptional regulator/antitoxin HigA